MGFFVGLTPFWTLQNLLLLAIAILTKVNLAAVFFALFFFSFVAFLFDPLFHDLGYAVLVNVESLQGLWTTLYNWPVVPFSRFNNTVVMGSALTALVLPMMASIRSAREPTSVFWWTWRGSIKIWRRR